MPCKSLYCNKSLCEWIYSTSVCEDKTRCIISRICYALNTLHDKQVDLTRKPPDSDTVEKAKNGYYICPCLEMDERKMRLNDIVDLINEINGNNFKKFHRYSKIKARMLLSLIHHDHHIIYDGNLLSLFDGGNVDVSISNMIIKDQYKPGAKWAKWCDPGSEEPSWRFDFYDHLDDEIGRGNSMLHVIGKLSDLFPVMPPSAYKGLRY